MTGRPTSVTLEQYRRLMEVRELRRRVPCNKTLSRELGLPVATISHAINRGLKSLDIKLAKERAS